MTRMEMDSSDRLVSGACDSRVASVRVFWIGTCCSAGGASRHTNQRAALLGASGFGSDPVGCELLSRSSQRAM